ncbi:hypothetical protein niasHS_009493 [Heterodera schachtii]|uniref:Protein kinase domain-containing protein n=1 Tax=Heterodera schachtii TaxID=97005 RepID=A0ABD2J0V6_HETSC
MTGSNWKNHAFRSKIFFLNFSDSKLAHERPLEYKRRRFARSGAWSDCVEVWAAKIFEAATASHEIGHAVIIWLLGVRQFLKATIVKKGGDLGYTLHSGPSSYTRTGLKQLMVVAAAGRVAELKAVGHSTGWQQDEKDWRRAAIMKLTDFGLSKRDVHGQLRTILGTPAFMAPEVRAGKYTMSADVFSLGSIFFLLLTRKYLPGANQMAMPSPADDQQQQKRMGNRIQQKQQQLQQQYLDLECIWNNCTPRSSRSWSDCCAARTTELCWTNPTSKSGTSRCRHPQIDPDTGQFRTCSYRDSIKFNTYSNSNCQSDGLGPSDGSGLNACAPTSFCSV